MPIPVSVTMIAAYAPAHIHRWMGAGVVLVEQSLGDFDRNPPIGVHGVPSIGHEIDQDLLDLALIGKDEERFGRESKLQGLVGAEELLQQRHETIYQRPQLDGGRPEHLLAAEGEQLLRDAGGPGGRLDHLLHVMPFPITDREFLEDEPAETDHHSHHVVHFMSDAAGQLSPPPGGAAPAPTAPASACGC